MAAVVAGTAVIAAAAAVTVTTLSWGADLRADGRLLPGTTIASVALGEVTTDEAVAALGAHVADVLDRTVEVAHHEHVYTTTARELGATADVDRVVADAVAHAGSVGFADLVRMRWLGGTASASADLPVDLPADAVDRFVADIAGELDRGPIEAEVAWVDDQVERTVDARAGRELDRDAAADAVTASLLGDGDAVALPFVPLPPDVDDDLADTVGEDVTALADAALDRPVTITLEGAEHTVTGRELDAVPDVAGALAAAFADQGVTTTPVRADRGDGAAITLSVPDSSMGALLDEVTAGTAVAAVNAELDVSGGGFRITPEQVGAAVDRTDAAADVRAALDGTSDTVALELAPVRPAITADSFDTVLVVRQSERTVELVRGGATVQQWPVAVGTGGSPTPTGTFVVGAKRFEPTWVNPAPDRWGADMPARIGPGPDNPLGVRAVNWNTLSGSDTLIRFHGTPNEASIGSASSNGCVRMFNADVVELYDLIDTGTTIVSVA